MPTNRLNILSEETSVSKMDALNALLTAIALSKSSSGYSSAFSVKSVNDTYGMRIMELS